jgi:phosphoribosylformylglycinamidine (FGAM) synthase-like amidotransferase family enzyme
MWHSGAPKFEVLGCCNGCDLAYLSELELIRTPVGLTF